MTAGLDTTAPFSSAAYWERRYRKGGDSGAGSKGALAEFKTATVNTVLAEAGARNVLDLGCGDGGQIGGFRVDRYTGIDVSATAIELCRERYADRPGWRFEHAEARNAYAGRFDAVLSLDVIYHLVEPAVFERYLADVFDHAARAVLIYSSDRDHAPGATHVLHRSVSAWAASNRTDWRLVRRIANPHGRDIDDPYRPDRSLAHFMLFAPHAGAP